MKTIGSILLIIGLMLSIVGQGLLGSTRCECPIAIGSQSASCSCGYNTQQQDGFVLLYSGIAIVISGIGLIVKPMFKKPRASSTPQN